MNSLLRSITFLSLVLICLTVTLRAQQDLLALPQVPEAEGEDQAEFRRQIWQLNLSTESQYIIGSDLDGADGEIDIWSNRLRLNYGGGAWLGSRFDFQLSFENRQYDFEGQNSFLPGTNDPWDSVNSFGVGVTFFQAFSKSWGGLIQATVRAAAEGGADLTDGVSGIIVAGVGHQFADNFRLGLGVTSIFRFEDSAIFLPGFIVDWQIDDDWRIAILGPQAEISYQATKDWQFGVGAGLDGRRYRLDDDNFNAIAQEFRVPVFARASWTPSTQTRLQLRFGVDIYREFNISDRNGENGRTFQADPGFFVSFSISHTF
ncbi:MAG: hypothetical protein ACI97A_003392 [Planctomycetota bacterium]|jgi:hypothetical protein